MACCNAQAGEVDGSDLALAQGQEALNDLRDLGWNEEVIHISSMSGAVFGLLVSCKTFVLLRSGVPLC